MRVTTLEVQRFKSRGERFPVLTAYDYPTAKLVEEAGVPVILVGDSLGQVVLGYSSTIPVTMEVMLHHTAAVVRGTERAMVVADMPFLSYNLSTEQALQNAGRFLQESGAQSVKLEGGVRVAEAVHRITEAGIPVMGHVGLTPQSVNQLGGYRVQGKGEAAAEALLQDALALQQAGAFSVVLELVPDEVASAVTERLTIPTIGIGAGRTVMGRCRSSTTSSATTRPTSPSTPSATRTWGRPSAAPLRSTPPTSGRTPSVPERASRPHEGLRHHRRGP